MCKPIGALPLPPSLWHWDGLVLAPRGVYEKRMDLSGQPGSGSGGSAATPSSEVFPLEYRYYPDAPPNSYIDAARRLPEVQTVLWFSRFPVTRFHKEGSDAIVEISDLRFPAHAAGSPRGIHLSRALRPRWKVAVTRLGRAVMA